MKRSRRHKVKQENPDTSTSGAQNEKEHDLAYYIHDRVELMHQVFAVLKPKELKAIAPECVRHISVSDLQELCMEELLGISSKRLCAILDGAEPPSDTESSSESSPDRLETISLDSISSDEEILSQLSAKKPKKHKHRSKSKKRKSKTKDQEDEGQADKDQADKSRRAGLTVLELLELQARARAIRAQLQQEQATAVSTEQASTAATGHISDDEVEIKEEAAEVVEISSEDEKPDIRELEGRLAATGKETASDSVSISSNSITKKVNDLVITVPHTNTSRKIKLKRNTKVTEQNVGRDKNTPTSSKENVVSGSKRVTTETSTQVAINTIHTVGKDSLENINTVQANNLTKEAKDKAKDKSKDKKKKRKKDRQQDKDGSDHDEITLQLSDSEKMDLLEDLEEKKIDKSSSGTEDSSEDSNSEDSSVDTNESHGNSNIVKRNINKTKKANKENFKDKDSKIANESVSDKSNLKTKKPTEQGESFESNIVLDLEKQTATCSETVEYKDKECTNNERNNEAISCSSNKSTEPAPKRNCDSENIEKNTINTNASECDNSGKTAIEVGNLDEDSFHNSIEITSISDIPLQTSNADGNQNMEDYTQVLEKKEERQVVQVQDVSEDQEIRIDDKVILNVTDHESQNKSPDTEVLSVHREISLTPNLDANVNKESLADKSEGELSDRDSSEVEASEFKSEVVCISDDEVKRGNKKKKKDKKSKKEKKSKKSKDFQINSDQNFYTETISDRSKPTENDVVILITDISVNANLNRNKSTENSANDDGDGMTVPETNIANDLKHAITEELSDKSECIGDDVYEILELSDDSSCYEVEEISISKEPTTEEIQALSNKIDEIEKNKGTEDTVTAEDLENISWKDRYLKSAKVKRVLGTANILNAMRKKNLELKQKLQKTQIKQVEINVTDNETNSFLEGSIDQYNTLETSNKYVDPVKELENTDQKSDNKPDESQDIISKSIDKEEGTDSKDNLEKGIVTKEMKKDAKQLLKMYKMLLKYNDITKEKVSSKKRKKKKKSKDKDKSVDSPTSVAS